MREMATRFGLWLANEIDKRDWQQSDLVERLDVKPGVVSAWINGIRRPSYESCLAIARALRIDPQVVLERAGRPTTITPRPRQLTLIALDGDEEYDIDAVVRHVENRPGRRFQDDLRAVREERTYAEYVEFCLSIFRAWESNSNLGIKALALGRGTGTGGL